MKAVCRDTFAAVPSLLLTTSWKCPLGICVRSYSESLTEYFDPAMRTSHASALDTWKARPWHVVTQSFLPGKQCVALNVCTDTPSMPLPVKAPSYHSLGSDAASPPFSPSPPCGAVLHL